MKGFRSAAAVSDDAAACGGRKKVVNAEARKKSKTGVKRAGLLFTIAAAAGRFLLKQHLSSVGQNTSPLTVEAVFGARLNSIMILGKICINIVTGKGAPAITVSKVVCVWAVITQITSKEMGSATPEEPVLLSKRNRIV